MPPFLETIRCDDHDISVLTRNVRILLWNLPRTKVYDATNPALFGILWWNSADDAILKQLHRAAVRIAQSAGPDTFFAMCHAPGRAARDFWHAQLADLSTYLRWRT